MKQQIKTVVIIVGPVILALLLVCILLFSSNSEVAIRYLKDHTFLFTILSFLVATTVGFFISRWIARRRLKREQGKMSLIVSSMGEGLLVVNEKYEIEIINDVAAKLFGIKKEQVIGQEWKTFVRAFKGDQEITFDKRSSVVVMQSKKTIYTTLGDDHYYVTRGGKKFPVISITAPLIEEGKVIGAVKVFRDATREKEERKIIEELVKERTKELTEAKEKISNVAYQLQQEQARLTASINSISIGFIIADKDHNIVMKNKAVAEILEIDENEITIDNINKKMGDEFDLSKNCNNCVNKVASYIEKEIGYGDQYLYLVITPVLVAKQGQKEATGYVLLIEDITEEVLLERSKDEFFAVASHELRTPLVAIRGNAEMLADSISGKAEDQETGEMLRDIVSAGKRLIDIVNDFLDVSRLEQGRLTFEMQGFDMVELIKEVTNELEGTASEKGLSLNMDLKQPSIPQITSDRNRIKQVLINLIGNAIKFTEKGEATVETGRNEDYITVKIHDTGVGISKQNQALLFKKFQKAGEKTYERDVTKGSGMGLYISRLIMNNLGGDVYLEKSEAGKGSTFVIKIPLSYNPQSSVDNLKKEGVES
jgi:PAS domain S-box-containing protein